MLRLKVNLGQDSGFAAVSAVRGHGNITSPGVPLVYSRGEGARRTQRDTKFQHYYSEVTE